MAQQPYSRLSAEMLVELPKVVLEVRYKDKSGRWRGTSAISLREIPKAILALQKAFEHLTTEWGNGFRSLGFAAA